MSDVENPYANPVSTAAPLSPAEEKQWSVLTHVLSIFFGVVAAGAFFFLFRDRGPFVRHHVTTEWNFQLTVTAISVVGFVELASASTVNAKRLLPWVAWPACGTCARASRRAGSKATRIRRRTLCAPLSARPRSWC